MDPGRVETRPGTDIFKFAKSLVDACEYCLVDGHTSRPYYAPSASLDEKDMNVRVLRQARSHYGTSCSS